MKQFDCYAFMRYMKSLGINPDKDEQETVEHFKCCLDVYDDCIELRADE